MLPVQASPGAGQGCCARSTASGAHAVRRAFDIDYYYDANGQQIRADAPGTAEDRYVDFDAHQRMSHAFVGALTAANFQAEYAYASDLSLATQVERNSAYQVSRRTHYVGKLEWTDRNPGGSANREARLSLPGGLILIKRFIEGQAATTSHRYLFYDVLGSVDVIADENGVAVERMSFDVRQ